MPTKPSPQKIRIDQLLLNRGLTESRSKAKAQIMAGLVLVNEVVVDKAGTLVKEDAEIRLKGKAYPDVSRAGLKLRYALENWAIPIEGSVCMDVGACTGGFTDVLLKHGANKIYAIDVGHNQLHWSLKTHDQVINMEKTHIVHMEPGLLGEKPSIAVCDVSFISLTRVAPAITRHLADDAHVVLLIKPQFEAERHEIGKGGIVRDDAVREAIRDRTIESISECGLELIEIAESPIKGGEGNTEYISLWKWDG